MAEILTPKPIERPSWPLSDRAAMFDALDELGPLGWRGGINRGQDSVWRIELNHSSGGQVIASAGDRLILEPFGGLVILTEEQATDNYDVVEE